MFTCNCDCYTLNGLDVAHFRKSHFQRFLRIYSLVLYKKWYNNKFCILKKILAISIVFNFFFQNYFQQFLQDLLGLSDVECSKWTRVRDIIPKFSSILACLKSNIELVNISNNWFTLMFSLAEVSMNSIPICEAKLVDPQSFTSLKTDLRLVI